MAYLMGIDLGTSSLKALIMDEEGKQISLASRTYEIEAPEPGFAEQACDTWWTAAKGAVRQALDTAAVEGPEIAAIGLSGQMHGMTALAADGIPVRPAILHCDARSARQIEALYRSISREQAESVLYNTVFPGFQIASLLWMRDMEPKNYEKAAWVLTPKDYLRYRLTGEIGTEETDASGTGAFDVGKRCWATGLIKKAGLDSALYPKVGRSAEIAGGVTATAAAQTGLASGTPVVYGGGDQPVQALGNGVIEPGAATSNIGTAGQVYTPVERPVHFPEGNVNMFCACTDGMWYAMGAMLSAGLSLKWLLKNVLERTGYGEIQQGTQHIPPCSGGLFFLPYLMGERTPYMDPDASAAFFGLRLRHNRMNMAKAVMEGVAFALRDCLEAVKSRGIPIGRIVCSGGGARSAAWLQIQADVFGQEVHTTAMEEQACTGAAMLAGIGCGIYKNAGQACEAAVKQDSVAVAPLPENVRQYRTYYPVYRELYASNRKLFHALAAK